MRTRNYQGAFRRQQQFQDPSSSYSVHKTKRSSGGCPSGLAQCWKLWRHCCCTYGWYPLAVAPVVTVAFLLSIYSSSDCQYLQLEVGFRPNSRAWNESQAELGFFYYYVDGSVEEKLTYHNVSIPTSLQQFFHAGCQPYSSDFTNYFIDNDRTWQVARVMAMISASAGALATLLVWASVLAPVPTDCLWAGLLLPSIVLCFIAEGTKFLFFDIALCQDPIWYPTGVDSNPTQAQSCNMSRGSFVGIAAGVVFLLALLMVCLRAPERRDLDPDFGRVYLREDNEALADDDDDNELEDGVDQLDGLATYNSPNHQDFGGQLDRRRTSASATTDRMSRIAPMEGSGFATSDSYRYEDDDDEDEADSRDERNVGDRRRGPPLMHHTLSDDDVYTSGPSMEAEDDTMLLQAQASNEDASTLESDLGTADHGVMFTSMPHRHRNASPGSQANTERPPAVVFNREHVSESRLSVMNKMERQTARQGVPRDQDILLQRLVDDLDTTFQNETVVRGQDDPDDAAARPSR